MPLTTLPFELRDYQRDFVTELRRAFADHQRIIGCGATGMGKSKTFIAMTAMALERNARKPPAERTTILILTESTKIFKQVHREQHGRLISAGTHQLIIEPGGVYLAMVQTLVRRPGMVSQFKKLAVQGQLLIINDEAHVGTSTRLLYDILTEPVLDPKKSPVFNRGRLIGFTATPDARTCKHLPHLYTRTVAGRWSQPAWLVDNGHLSPYRHIARVGADLDALQLQNGEFTEASQERAFGKKRVYDGLVNDLQKVVYKKCLIFTASIHHCEAVGAELRAAGFAVAVVHSKSSEAELHNFMHGTVDICVSVGILTKGFDYPPIDLIVLLRAVNSLPLYLQMCGRGSRLSPQTGKTGWTVLDYGENFTRHWLWDYERDWEKLAAITKRSKKEGVTPIKNCPSCDSVINARARLCPHCGHVFEIAEEEGPPPETQLVEITGMYEKLRGRYVSTLSPEELAVYAKLKNKRPYAARVACAHEQVTPGWLKMYGAAMGYKPYWAKLRAEELTNKPKIEYHDAPLR